MAQTVFKHGDSLAITLPQELVDSIGIEVGSTLEAAVQEGKIVLQQPAEQPASATQDREFVDRIYDKREEVFKALGE